MQKASKTQPGENTMKRRTEITIETERLLVIQTRKTSVRAWCPSCNQRVQMLTTDEAARVSRVSSRVVYRWIEADKLHFTEASGSRLKERINL
jgi:excisionase family DNA binding protein